MRIDSTEDEIVDEINDVICACHIDLEQSGAVNVDETDALIIRAITLYCKAHFGYDDQSERYQAAYDKLKRSLAMSSRYNSKEVDDATVDE